MHCRMQSKTVGWVLLIVGVVGALGSYAYSWGMLWALILIIVALIGAWMTFFNDVDSGTPPPAMPPM